ncbi:MAG: S1 RNA-binding domain-containing protein, partial [Pirellulaceae bacterium]
MLIGPGGRNIRAIQEETGTVVEVDDEGTVTIAGDNAEWVRKAVEKIEACTASVEIGKIYDGVVSSVKDFGAFVEILPGRDGLCHISELSSGFVSNISDLVSEGDEMKVLVVSVDEHDRVKLSRRQALEQLGLEDEMVTEENSGDGPSKESSESSNDGGGGERSGGRGGRGRRSRR